MSILTLEEQKNLFEISKRKPEKWEDLNEEEQKIFEKLSKDIVIMHLCQFLKMKKCYMCSAKFPDRLLISSPYSSKPLLKMFNPKFLIHLKTTHGLEPETFEMVLRTERS